MPIGRYFQGLTTFDLLGNLLPGTVVILAVYGFLPSLPLPESVGGYGLFALTAFSIGMFVQYHASFATGERRSFRWTIRNAERLENLTKRPGDADGPDRDDGRVARAVSLLWGVTHAYLDPLISPYRSDRGRRLDDAILTNNIWNHLTETYAIPPNTDAVDVLYHLMSSKIDDVGTPSRAVRFQALRNFNRGMWVASWYLLLTLLCAWTADACWTVGETVYSGVVYTRPAYFDYWTPLWHLVGVALVLVWGFWVLTESFEEDYVEYLFSDYAVAIAGNGTEVTLASDSRLEIVHGWDEQDRPERAGGNDGNGDGGED
jgi:hypothetical protein